MLVKTFFNTLVPIFHLWVKLAFILTAKRLHCTNTSLIVYSVVLPCNHQSTKKVMGRVFCITPNAR